ncbi:GNAT family N-acetyltransferase [Rhodospira trueperi]|uniref:Acetyltransferase (GNAT) family protein n=1 Tax=Rhodospira trueperi TaxID=69960 RepID=A0A1G7BRT5_9PROT|nr:GNAT family N-acetyltransferase [Rhodospira trueperi]SDE29713.1 Acetyltransferase (GNAT) family protein [Rhodospira trueperi]
MPDTATVHPLTPDRFPDLEALFATGGEARDCWCMYWRVTPKGWDAGSGETRRAAFRDRVAAGPPPGLLAYRGAEAVGWVQVTPRAEVPRFNRARSAKPSPPDADLNSVWALSCFYLRKDARRRGLMTVLAREACAFAARHGAAAVEAAPITPRRPLMWGEGYVGIASALERAGFLVVETRTDLRSLMRWVP